MSNMFAYVKVLCVPPHGKWTLTWNSHITRTTQLYFISSWLSCHWRQNVFLTTDDDSQSPLFYSFSLYIFIILFMHEAEEIDNITLKYTDFWVIRINQTESYDERITFYIEVSKETS